MRNEKKVYKYVLLLLSGPLAAALTYAASASPMAVERLYSNSIYKPLSQILSRATGILPFSLAEIIVITLVILSLTAIAAAIIKVCSQKMRRLKVLLSPILGILMAGSIIYFCFIFLWGLNYHRLSFGEIADLNTGKASIGELKDLCQYLIGEANEMRGRVEEDQNGVFKAKGGIKGVFNRSPLGYEAASRIYPELGGAYGNPKPVMLSEVMSYAGISGVYFPFTAEANVNIKVPDSMLPSTACHEMAHQRGFAREDEANYIAYLTCILHPDVDFKYSGTVLALINSMNALYSHDQESYLSLREEYSEGLKRDLKNINDFWERYEGPIEEISSEINNAYLKSNLQRDGVYSYGRMVDLLIAEHRKKLSK